jgi:hypothetical protein
MNVEQIQFLGTFGQFLLGPQVWQKSVLETLTAISVSDPDSRQWMDRACELILARSSEPSHSKIQGRASDLSSPFRRAFLSMAPEHQFLLVASHLGHFSYARLSGIWSRWTLRCSGEGRDQVRSQRVRDDLYSIQKRLWAVRLSVLDEALYPAPPISSRVDCPEFDSKVPWTQRMLDQECQGSERLFLVEHVLLCVSCASALARARLAYYRVDAQLKAWSRELESSQSEDFSRRVLQTLRQNPRYPLPLSSSHEFWKESLLGSIRAFFELQEIQVVSLLGILALLYTALRH